jgi:hypothetical protein
MLPQPGNQQKQPELPPPPAYKITRGHSCILCQQRKVRCDRQKPCANCIKARAECVPSAPTLPRRRRRKLAETDIAGRLKRAEHLLRTHGVKIDDDEEEEQDVQSYKKPEPERVLSLDVPRRPHHGHHQHGPPGALFKDKENSHYVERYIMSSVLSSNADHVQYSLGELEG